MILSASIVDITTLAVDAIVSAANSALIPGGGVDGAINRAAGPELAVAMQSIGGCPTGEARITPGFALRARYVIHAAGPIWNGGASGEAELLASAYRSSLDLAVKHACRTVAFPAISTGVYGYPLDEATRIAVDTVQSHSNGSEIVEVHFACFSERALKAYRDAIAQKTQE